MNFGLIDTAECVNTPPPSDSRCGDPAFALANPDICPAAPRLVIKPGVALVCSLRNIQFKATYIANGIETDVTNQTLFKTSNPNVAVVGAASGNATGLSAGDAAISATYKGATVFADLTVLGDDCCDSQKVAIMVLIDRTKSFSQSFSSAYQTKLHYAKKAATDFINSINTNKDVVGLMQFTAASYEILSEPSADKAAVAALVPGIAQTQQLTTYYDALSAAIDSLNAVTDADRRMIVLITEGEDSDTSYLDESNPIALVEEFKEGGGIVLPLGVRSHGRGYALLSQFSTGGFFINAHEDTEEISLEYLNGLKGYVCAGNCTPTGDEMVASGSLNYCGFENWLVKEGRIDLIGNGFLDLIPGSGLYVDLAGSTSPYNGKMILKSALSVEEGKAYSISLLLAGNQRVDAAPNSVNVRVFERNTDGLENPTNPVVTSAATGSGSGSLETYDYAVSYTNANGETELSPVATETNGSFETFSIALTADAMANALTARFWKRLTGTDRWYLIAESDATSPAATDTLNEAALAAAVADGTLDSCELSPESNTTGTPIVLAEQTYSINDFQQGFSTFTASFVASHDADVFISIQQTQTPSGHDATGLLLGQVTFRNVTDAIDLLDDDFDGENIQYLAPACGLGSNYVMVDDNGNPVASNGFILLSGALYGYVSGYNCYGDGCLEEPPAVQTEDPNPLADIEAGYSPPQLFTSNKTVCKSCPEGFKNFGDEVTWSFRDSEDTGTELIGEMTLAAATVLGKYCVTAGTLGNFFPYAFALYGSNDGTTWTLLDEQEQPHWVAGQTKCFVISSTTAWLYTKLVITDYDVISFPVGYDFTLPVKFYAVGITEVCKSATGESEVSQGAADASAIAAATALAVAELNCSAVYRATVSHTAKCAVNTYGLDVTKTVTYESLISQADANAKAQELAQEAAEAELDCTLSNNEQPIQFNNGTGASATPYPSVKFVEGLSGVISKVTVTLKGVRHLGLKVVRLVLRSPDGTCVMLLGLDNSGLQTTATPATDFVIDDDGATPFPHSNPTPAGTYQPTAEDNNETVQLAAPAPNQPYGTSLSDFNGLDPNGAWSLWAVHGQFYTVFDLANAKFFNGWELTITTA